ncbi:hypothetical protein CZ765_07775 [Corynebacterium casei]|nr:hypothetical protein CZ765_07775 [Corynebacterium casei]
MVALLSAARPAECLHDRDALHELHDPGVHPAQCLVPACRVLRVSAHHHAQSDEVQQHRHQAHQAQSPVDDEQQYESRERGHYGSHQVVDRVCHQMMHVVHVILQAALHLTRGAFSEPAQRHPPQPIGQSLPKRLAHRSVRSVSDGVCRPCRGSAHQHADHGDDRPRPHHVPARACRLQQFLDDPIDRDIRHQGRQRAKRLERPRQDQPPTHRSEQRAEALVTTSGSRLGLKRIRRRLGLSVGQHSLSSGRIIGHEPSFQASTHRRSARSPIAGPVQCTNL